MAHPQGHFTWRGIDINGIDKLFEAAMKCSTKEEAEDLIKAAVAAGTPRDILLEQLGYMSGYYSQEALDKIVHLFGGEHPVFKKKLPSLGEAFKMGIERGKKLFGRK